MSSSFLVALTVWLFLRVLTSLPFEVNHSCSPTTEVHLPPFRPNEWGVYATSKGLKKGESLEFFYPSTEWDMAQGFDCACGSDVSFY